MRHLLAVACLSVSLLACALTGNPAADFSPSQLSADNQQFLTNIQAYETDADAFTGLLNTDLAAAAPHVCAAIAEADGGFKLVQAASSVVTPQAAAAEASVMTVADVACAAAQQPDPASPANLAATILAAYQAVQASDASVGVAAAPPVAAGAASGT